MQYIEEYIYDPFCAMFKSTGGAMSHTLYPSGSICLPVQMLRLKAP